MQRLRPLSKVPPAASSVAPEVKLAYIRDVINLTVPLVTNKDASNPTTTGT
jgi:hypothetical protein